MSRRVLSMGAVTLIVAGFAAVGAGSGGRHVNSVSAAMTTAPAATTPDTTTPDTTTPDTAAPESTTPVPATSDTAPTMQYDTLGEPDWRAVVESLPDESAFPRLGRDIGPFTVSCGLRVAISSDGNVLAVAAPGDPGSQTGAVRVYRWIGSDWAQVGGPVSVDGTGFAIALAGDGERLAVAGSVVRVHEWNDSTSGWEQIGEDLAAGADSAVLPGGRTDVALSENGTRLAVGRTPDGATVYDWEATTGSWVRVGGTVLPGEGSGAVAAVSVDLSGNGDRLAVGASFWDIDPDLMPDPPLVALYRYAAPEARWVRIGSPVPRSGVGGLVDVALSVTGDRIAVGTTAQLQVIAPDASEFIGFGAGRAFDLADSTSWTRAGDTQESDRQIWFGRSIDLSADGGRMAIGGTPMRVYDWDRSAAAWRRIGVQVDLGDDVALSADGNRLAFSSCYLPQNVVRVVQVGAPVPDPPTPELPATGTDTSWLALGGVLVAAGALALISARANRSLPSDADPF